MREIKFRAWDKKENKWLEKEYYHLIDLVGNIRVYSLGKLYDTDNIIELQQFTGLKDKNGKDIYEGDIIKDYEGKLSQVIWLDDNSKFWIKRLNWKQNGEDTWHIITFSGEIIGNIFENQELLTANHNQSAS